MNTSSKAQLRGYSRRHSKGGNLAVFAASHASNRVMKRITAVYNNDGPGFQTSVIESEGYQKMLGRIRTYIPNSSIVGLLLEHGENYTVVACREKGLMSHNSVTWEVSGNAFVRAKEITKSSRQLNEALRVGWQPRLEQREAICRGAVRYHSQVRPENTLRPFERAPDGNRRDD